MDIDPPIIPHVAQETETPTVQTPEGHLPAPTEEQIRASDEVFGQPPSEGRADWEELAAGLIAMHAGTLLVRDHVGEHLRRPRQNTVGKKPGTSSE